MKFINKVIACLKGEPVAISAAVAAGLVLVEAVQHHALTEGVITSALLAVLGLFTRTQVTPTSGEDSAGD